MKEGLSALASLLFLNQLMSLIKKIKKKVPIETLRCKVNLKEALQLMGET